MSRNSTTLQHLTDLIEARGRSRWYDILSADSQQLSSMVNMEIMQKVVIENTEFSIIRICMDPPSLVLIPTFILEKKMKE